MLISAAPNDAVSDNTQEMIIAQASWGGQMSVSVCVGKHSARHYHTSTKTQSGLDKDGTKAERNKYREIDERYKLDASFPKQCSLA